MVKSCNTANEIAVCLIKDRSLPFGSFYTLPTSARQWISFGQARQKSRYDAGAFEAYDLKNTLNLSGKTNRLGLVSLGTGQGFSEIELLKSLFRRNKHLRIDYIAVDSSRLLMREHKRLIHSHLRQELLQKRLTFAPDTGDLFDLKDRIRRQRTRIRPTFLKDVPTLVTYFGNCLGNHEQHEGVFFEMVLKALPKSRISFLVGISLVRTAGGKSLEDRYTLDPFVLETPKHLMHNLGILRSAGSKNRDEFSLKDASQIKSDPYRSKEGIKGRVYRFRYRLKYDLLARGIRAKLSKGTTLLLYSIIKYNLSSLERFLRKRGFKVECPLKRYRIQEINDGGKFHYAVIAATIDRK